MMLRLRHERLTANLSQGGLGKLSGHTGSEISLFEGGRMKPTHRGLERIARVLKVWPPHILMKPVVVTDPEETDMPPLDASTSDTQAVA